jgi:hypothetical protein
MGAHAYATTNLLSGLAGTAFTYSSGSPTAADRALLCDGRMDKRITTTGHAGSFTIVVDMGAATAIAGWALLNNNLALITNGQGTVRIRAATDSGITTGVVTPKDTTTLASYLSLNTREPRNKDHVLQFASVSKRYWELTLAWGSGSIANLSIGEMFAYATPTQLTRKGIYGSGDSEQMYTSELQFGNGETRGLFMGGPCRMKTLRWQDLDDDETDELRTLWYAARGNTGKVLFINSYEATSTAAAAAEQDCIYGRLTQLDGIEYPEMDYGLYGFEDITVRSLGREVGA